jgi:alkylation response protein AidB-like acyl-CoA dehydrogenase
VDVAACALAAEELGAAEACMDSAVAYAKVREQFGQPIGSFQAVKHRCADMLVWVESARSAAHYAAWAAGQAGVELQAIASMAQVYCSEALFFCAGESIQVHGGIGFTWEHDAHLFFKRAQSAKALFGTPAFHRERIALGLLG